MHILETDGAVADLKRRGIRGRGDRRLYIENGEDADRGGDAFLHHGLCIREFFQRFIGEHHGGEKAAEIADGEKARLHTATAKIDDGGDADARQCPCHGTGHDPASHGAQGMVENVVDRAAGAVDFGCLLIVGLDHADAAQGFGDHGGEVAGPFHALARGLAGAAPELTDKQCDNRNDCGAHERELPVEIEHGANKRDYGQKVLAQIDDGGGDGIAHAARIVQEARYEPAGMSSAHPCEVGMNNTVEHIALYGGHDVLADRAHVHLGNIGGDGLQRCRDDCAEGHQEQHPGVRTDDIVERIFDENRQDAGRAGNDDTRQ